jgi:hypothetical protein
MYGPFCECKVESGSDSRALGLELPSIGPGQDGVT